MDTFFTTGTAMLCRGWYAEVDHMLIDPHTSAWNAISEAQSLVEDYTAIARYVDENVSYQMGSVNL